MTLRVATREIQHFTRPGSKQAGLVLSTPSLSTTYPESSFQAAGLQQEKARLQRDLNRLQAAHCLQAGEVQRFQAVFLAGHRLQEQLTRMQVGSAFCTVSGGRRHLTFSLQAGKQS